MKSTVLHSAFIFALLVGFGLLAAPARAAAVHRPGMILTVSPGPDTAPNNPCATSLSQGVLKGNCGLRAAIDAANVYLAGFATEHPPTTNPMVLINMKAGTYSLTHGSLVVNAATDSTATKPGFIYGLVKIDGASAATTIIDGSGNTGNNVGPVMTLLAPADVGGVTARNASDSGGGTEGQGGGFYVATRFSLHDAVVTRNYGAYGGGLYIAGPLPFTMRNTVISDNVTVTGGGGIASLAPGTLTSVKVHDNIACRAFAYPSASPFTASGKPDPRNPCIDDGDGGGILTSAPLRIVDSAITGNVAGFEEPRTTNDAYGGGIVNGSNLVITNSIIDGNFGGRQGGGIYSFEPAGATVVVNGGEISGNTAGISGGGIFQSSGQTFLNGVTMTGNTAGGRLTCTLPTQEPSGPACTFKTGSPGPNHTTLPTVKHCSTACTVLNGNGGGIISAGDVAVSGGSITGNRAVGDSENITCLGRGGGIYSTLTGFLTTSGNLTISNNGALCGGGIYTTIPADLSDTTISKNYAFLQGGGLYILTSHPSNPTTVTTVTLEDVTITDNTAGEATGGLWDQYFSDFFEDDATSITNNKGPTGDHCPNVAVPCS